MRKDNMRWSIRMEVAKEGAAPPDSDALFDLLEFLEPFDASVTGTPEEPEDGKARYGVRMVVDEADPSGAAERAVREFLAGVEKCDLPKWPFVFMSIIAEDELEAEVNRPNFPELVGVSELAALLGVSRQRASAVAKGPTFPKPVASLHSGPVWTKPSVGRYVASWPRKPGRPVKVDAD